MTNTLQVPVDVGATCRMAAEALESSRRFLDRQISHAIEAAACNDDPEWPVMFNQADIERTRDNLAKAAQFLDWLAQHGAHGQPVERVGD